MLPALFLTSVLSASPADTWAGFRNDGSGHTTATGLPFKWSPTADIAGRVSTTGGGQPSPVAWKDRVYVTSVEGEQKEKMHVGCYALTDSKKLWAKAFDAIQKRKNNPMTSRAAGMPAADSDGVYTMFESGDLIALSHTGEVRWERHFAKEFGELKNNHGLGSSPAQTEKTVVVLLDLQGPGKLVAVNKVDRKGCGRWTAPPARRGRVQWW